jgi:hypothetical protein
MAGGKSWTETNREKGKNRRRVARHLLLRFCVAAFGRDPSVHEFKVVLLWPNESEVMRFNGISSITTCIHI